MEDFLSRTEVLTGKENIEKLKNSTVTLFGLGGVGSYTAEALARCGIGAFNLIDEDKVSVSNINRQIIALHSTVGRYKTDIAKERLLDINPDVKIKTYPVFYLPDVSLPEIFKTDYIIDAIDTVSAKLDIIGKANKKNIPIISAMGAGNKLDPTLFEISDIYKTSVCPLCRVMRRELKKRNIKSLKCVYSKEKPITHEGNTVPGSIAFVPSVMGLLIAYEVIKDLLDF